MNPLEAFNANAATFYDTRTGNQHSLFARYAAMAIGSVAISVCGIKLADGIISDIITVLGVLLGFGFSVQFYIAGTDLPIVQRDEYLEDVADKKILKKLSSEIYANVVYQNYLILFCLISSFSIRIENPIKNIPDELANGIYLFGVILNFLLVLEVIFTFYRVLRRSSFFFSERARLANTQEKIE